MTAPATPEADAPGTPAPAPAAPAGSQAGELDGSDEAALPAPTPEPELVLEAPPPSLPAPPGIQSPRGRLLQRMSALEAERAASSNLLPWLTVGTGAAVVVVSASVGAISAFDCEPDTSCSAPPWASLAVVIGVAIGTAGAVWLIRTDADIRELERQKNQLQLDLDRLDHARLRREGLARRTGPQLSFRARF